MECSDVMWVQLVTWQLGVYDKCQQSERAKYDKIWAATSVIKLLCDSAMTDGHMDHKYCSHKQKNIIMTTYTHTHNNIGWELSKWDDIHIHYTALITIITMWRWPPSGRLSGCPATTRSPGRRRSNLIG